MKKYTLEKINAKYPDGWYVDKRDDPERFEKEFRPLFSILAENEFHFLERFYGLIQSMLCGTSSPTVEKLKKTSITEFIDLVTMREEWIPEEGELVYCWDGDKRPKRPTQEVFLHKNNKGDFITFSSDPDFDINIDRTYMVNEWHNIAKIEVAKPYEITRTVTKEQEKEIDKLLGL